MKNIKKALKVITMSFLISLMVSAPIYADTKSGKSIDVYIEQYDPLDVWKPGDNRTFKFKIENNTNNKIKVDSISIFNKIRKNIGLNHLQENTKLVFKYEGEIISDEGIILKEMLKKQDIVFKKNINIDKNSEETLVMEIIMDEEMGNEAQSISSVYSFKLGYKKVDSGGGGEIQPPEKPPTDPDNPPTDPDNPEKPPTNPENPSNPDDPSNPNNPGTPSNPDNPDNPNNPGTPSNPSNPNKPGQGNDTDVSGDADKLPQTGGIINGASIGVLGLSLVGAGIVIDKKASNKGGKADE